MGKSLSLTGMASKFNNEKINLYCVLRPATLLKDSTSKFYLLCKAAGKEEFATLKKMAGV